ncbi:MAG: hypothetical protein GDA40_09775 [Rhodobacteraceae bacterium]|nr:hypothetical protein [Paracoccaceae bacterium]
MSNPVLNEEIEDVLSSIHRLFSEETQNVKKQMDEPSDDGKLVLTPSLRVQGPDALQDAPEGEAETDIVPEASALLLRDAARAPWEDPNARLFEVAEDAPDGRESPLVLEAWAKNGPPGMDEAALHGKPVDEIVEDVVPGSANDIDCDPGSGDDDAPDAAQDGVSERRAAVLGAPDFPGAQNVSGVGVDTGPETDAPTGSTEMLSSKIEALEAVVSAAEDEVEPSGTAAFSGISDEAIVSEHDDVARLTVDETILDEERLRELVAEIVRQELQEALGERITRNVRKLVRREIHRALTAQNFE